MKRYHTVIFDLDGTLLDTLEDLTDAVNYALRSCNEAQRSMDEVCNFVGNGIEKLMERAVLGGHDNPHFAQIFEQFKKYYGMHCNDKTKPYEGVVELLKQLKASGYHLAIVSNKADFAVKELQKIYFVNLVDVAIGEKQGIRKKPAPDTVNQALLELGCTKENAVYVGDSDVDIQTAKNVGIPCISVTWGFRDRQFLREHGASHFADKAEDIATWLSQENKD